MPITKPVSTAKLKITKEATQATTPISAATARIPIHFGAESFIVIPFLSHPPFWPSRILDDPPD
jgi:phage host-nuclease inhibitor protein Gam